MKEESAATSRKKAGPIRRVALALAVLVAGGLAAVAWWTGSSLRTATGAVSEALCAGVFVSGLDPAQVYREQQLPLPGMSILKPVLRYSVDRTNKEVRATVLGGFGSRAVYREGFGSHLVHGDAPSVLDSAAPPAAEAGTPGDATKLAEAIDPRLSAALDAAFAEVDARALRQTKAVVVLHDGKLVAERYAPGYGVDTPIWGHSLTKAVTNVLIGMLVQEGRLKTGQTIRLPASDVAGGGQRDVTLEQLLRMDSGLPPDETDDAVTLATRMWFLEPDSVAFAKRQPLAAPPGTRWAYSNLGYALLSGVIRDAAGGGPRETLAFLRRELFRPLGMGHATLEFDAAGTPEGNGFMFASARDWARFGQFCLDDGVARGRRLLPAGWIKDSTTPTLDTGYGAGFWTNRKQDGEVPYWGIPWGLPGLPADTYFGRGALGQFIVVVPSRRLVVVRLGLSHDTSPGITKLVESVLATLPPDPTDG